MEAADRRDGFMMIETLVAIAIFTSVSMALAQATIIGWRGLRSSQHAAQAMQLGRSLLAKVGTEIPLEPTVLVGHVAPGFDWSIEMTGYAGGESDEVPSTLIPFRVAISVSIDEGAKRKPTVVRLASVKLARRK